MYPILTPLTPYLGYEVSGIDLTQPLAPQTQALLQGAMATRGLLVFHEQTLDEDQQIAFARLFGEISKQGPIQRLSPDATYVSNVRSDGTFGDGELKFHSDQAYFDLPMKAIMLYGIEVTEHGGETLFSNAAVAVGRLPAQLRDTLSRHKVLNRLDYRGLQFGPDVPAEVADFASEAWHPVLTRHRPSGQLIHMISPDTSQHLDGLSIPASHALIDEVHAIVADPEIVYRHPWREGDLLVWDNMLLQHARAPFPENSRRTLRRCAIGQDAENPIATTHPRQS